MEFDAETWPVALLGLRIVAVVLLYLFLLTAFRALRAELRAPALPQRRATAVSSAVERALPARVAAPAAVEAVEVAEPWQDEADEAEEEWDEDADDGSETAPAGVAPNDAYEVAPSRRVGPRVWVPVAAAILVAAFGGTAFLLADTDPGAPPAAEAPNGEATVNPSDPPTVIPAPGRVTVGLAATEDAQVRVTVDGTVQFDGMLAKGERQSWEGGERIQVWTDNGKTLQLSVNGADLGAYSPAMGHPDWNRIDFGFWPGWAQ